MIRGITMVGWLAAGMLGTGAVAQAQPEPQGPKALALGDTAPLADVAMMNVDGHETTIAGAHGAKGTLVVFTCNACPWAKAWHTRIVSLGNRCVKQGIGVIAINSNDPGVVPEDGYQVMQANARRSKMAFPYVVDATSDVARAFGATRTPEAFLFDREGKLVYHGTIDDNAKQPGQVKERYLQDAVQAVIDGRDIALAETKALGCSIKFRSKT
jgi:redoxin